MNVPLPTSGGKGMIHIPIRKRALAAHRLSQQGIRGKAAGGKLKCSTDDANRLKAVGHRIVKIESSLLSDRETLLLRSLGDIEMARLQEGIVSSPSACQVSRRARKYGGWAASASRRLRLDYSATDTTLGLVRHSHNGHIWLTPAGWAVYGAFEAAAKA